MHLFRIKFIQQRAKWFIFYFWSGVWLYCCWSSQFSSCISGQCKVLAFLLTGTSSFFDFRTSQHTPYLHQRFVTSSRWTWSPLWVPKSSTVCWRWTDHPVLKLCFLTPPHTHFVFKMSFHIAHWYLLFNSSVLCSHDCLICLQDVLLIYGGNWQWIADITKLICKFYNFKSSHEIFRKQLELLEFLFTYLDVHDSTEISALIDFTSTE